MIRRHDAPELHELGELRWNFGENGFCQFGLILHKQSGARRLTSFGYAIVTELNKLKGQMERGRGQEEEEGRHENLTITTLENKSYIHSSQTIVSM